VKSRLIESDSSVQQVKPAFANGGMAYVLQFHRLHDYRCAKIIVGLNADFCNVYQTFRNVLFLNCLRF